MSNKRRNSGSAGQASRPRSRAGGTVVPQKAGAPRRAADSTGSPVSAAAGSLSWPTIVAVLVVLGLAIGVFAYSKTRHPQPFRPAANDPSLQIPGVEVRNYGQKHVQPDQRVAYDQSPPFGGPHDLYWAACNAVVYPRPVRSENMVHSLEHGAIWIAYDPARIGGAALAALRRRVVGQPYTMLSPYPRLDRPLSVQSWGHRLKLDDPNDPRLDEFIRDLRLNPSTYPEVGASCDALGPGSFDQDNPPPFDPTPPGPDAVPVAEGQG